MTVPASDLTKSIQELEGVDWGEDTFGSYVTRTSHALRRKRLADLTAEEIRLGIGQQIGLPYLVPLALDPLWPDVFLEVAYFPGDLLTSMLRVPPEFWTAHAAWRKRAEMLALQYFAQAAGDPEHSEVGLKAVRETYAQFAGQSAPNRWLREKDTPPRAMN